MSSNFRLVKKVLFYVDQILSFALFHPGAIYIYIKPLWIDLGSSNLGSLHLPGPGFSPNMGQGAPGLEATSQVLLEHLLHPPVAQAPCDANRDTPEQKDMLILG